MVENLAVKFKTTKNYETLRKNSVYLTLSTAEQNTTGISKSDVK